MGYPIAHGNLPIFAFIKAALMSLPTLDAATHGRMIGRPTLMSMAGPGFMSILKVQQSIWELTRCMNSDMIAVTRVSSLALCGITHENCTKI